MHAMAQREDGISKTGRDLKIGRLSRRKRVWVIIRRAVKPHVSCAKCTGEFIVRLLLLFVSETVEMLLMTGTRITLDITLDEKSIFRAAKITFENTTE